MSKLLTTTEAARIAGVTPSSIKRWADQSLLPCVKTPGGHRRIEASALDRFLREAIPTDDETPSQTQELLELMVSDSHHGIVSHLFGLMHDLGSWCQVADTVGPVLTLMGERWHSGKLTVAQEHGASHALSKALSFIGNSLPEQKKGKRCLLAVVEGDDHDLGLRLVDLCLRARHWKPIWLGRDTPSRVLIDRITSGNTDMVAMSASRYSVDAMKLRTVAERVAETCRRTGTRLVLGGEGSWPHGLRPAEHITNFTRFDELLVKMG